MVSTALAPKRPRWLASAIGLTLVVLLWWTVLVLLGAHGTATTGDFWGMTFGGFAAGLCFVQTLYPLRRRFMARPFRTAQDGLQFHIYSSSLAFVFALAHVGMRAPKGVLGWSLVIIGGWTLLSGVAGIVLEKVLPPAVAGLSPIAVPIERLPEAVESLRRDADAAVQGAPDVFTNWYESQVRGALNGINYSWSHVVGRSNTEQAVLAAGFDHPPSATGPDAVRLQALRSIVEQKLHLDARASLQRALRSWLVLHVPAAMALVALILWHIFTVVYF